MKGRLLVFASLAIAMLAPATLLADVTTFLPGSSGVASAINSGGFFVADNTDGLFGADAWTADFTLAASGAGYSDAGLVLYFDGGLTLGQLQGVSVDSSGSPLAVNLWLDTGGDGKFFAFDPSSGLMTSLSNDSYAGCGAPAIGESSSCYMLGGDGAGSQPTLANLQAGVIPGIGASTPVALWVGIVNGGGQDAFADVNSITVTTASTPEPGVVLLLVTMCAGLAGAKKLKLV